MRLFFPTILPILLMLFLTLASPLSSVEVRGDELYAEMAAVIVKVQKEDLKNHKEDTEDAPLAKHLYALRRFKNEAVARVLSKNFTYPVFFTRLHAHESMIERAFPALKGLIVQGTSTLPFIFSELANIPQSKKEENEIMFSADFLAVHVTSRIIDAKNADQVISIFNQYANEYDLQAMRLRILADQLPDVAPTKPVAIKPSLTEEEQITRLARILELQDLIQNEKLTQKDEVSVIAAIAEMGQLGATEAASALADKLDWERPPAPPQKEDRQKVDPYAGDTFALLPAAPEVMTADPKGLLSPKITQAAMKALGEIGAPALPVIVEAVSQRRRLPRFRDNAMTLVVQLSGGKVEGIGAMNKAAEDNDKKVKRLRELAASLVPTN